MPKKSRLEPDEGDKFIGERLLARRRLRDMSLDKVAEAMGMKMTAARVEAYEAGTVRFTHHIIARFAEVLNTDMSYFRPRSSSHKPYRDPRKVIH